MIQLDGKRGEGDTGAVPTTTAAVPTPSPLPTPTPTVPTTPVMVSETVTPAAARR